MIPITLHMYLRINVRMDNRPNIGCSSKDS
jgi:hypothetical protein